jgi:hypothetical protein
MSNYDVAISIDQATLNRVIATAFGRQSLRSKLFSGRQTITFQGVQVTVGWEVQQVPTLSLTPPSTQQWQNAIKQDGGAAQPMQNAFVVNIPQLKVTMENTSGKIEEATTSVEAICTISINALNNKLSLDPVALVVDLSQASAFDKVIYRTFLIPQVLHMADSLLSDEQFPDIDFKGIRFGPAVLIVGTGRIVAIANLQGKPAPSAPPADSFPDGPLYILLSREAMQQVVSRGTQDLRGKRVSASGSRDFTVGKANYNVSLQFDSVSASLTNDLTVVNASLGVSVSASAGVDVVSAIGGTIVNAAKTVGDGVVSAGKAVADAFSSY